MEEVKTPPEAPKVVTPPQVTNSDSEMKQPRKKKKRQEVDMVTAYRELSRVAEVDRKIAKLQTERAQIEGRIGLLTKKRNEIAEPIKNTTQYLQYQKQSH